MGAKRCSDYRIENHHYSDAQTVEDTHLADPPPDPDGDDTGSTPRWVKVFGVIAAVLVVLFVILHLAGGGLRDH